MYVISLVVTVLVVPEPDMIMSRVSCGFGPAEPLPTDQSSLTSLAPGCKFPSFQAYMETPNTAHNHWSKPDIFPGLVCSYMFLHHYAAAVSDGTPRPRNTLTIAKS